MGEYEDVKFFHTYLRENASNFYGPKYGRDGKFVEWEFSGVYDTKKHSAKQPWKNWIPREE